MAKNLGDDVLDCCKTYHDSFYTWLQKRFGN